MRQAVAKFLAINGAICIAVLGTMAQEDARKQLFYNPIFWITLAVIEIVVCAYVYWQWKSDQKDVDRWLPADDIHRERTVVRFGLPGDADGTSRVYDEWFSQDLAINDDEYEDIVERGKFIRVAEVTSVYGNERSTKICGYYSVFPIKMSTFEDLRDSKIRERDLTSSMILDFDDINAEVLYVCEIISSLSCDVRYALLSDIKDFIYYLLDKNQNIKGIAAWPYTSYGKKLIDRLRMTPVGKKRLRHYISEHQIHYISRRRIPNIRSREFLPTREY